MNIYYILLIPSSVDGLLSCFCLLATVNNVALNVDVRVSVQVSLFSYFCYIRRSELAGSYNSVFNFLRHCQTFYLLTSHAQRLQFHASLFLFVFIIAILMSIKWYLIMLLICISPMISDVECLFLCLLSICVPSLEKYLFKSFCPFKNHIVSWWVVGKSCLFLNWIFMAI